MKRKKALLYHKLQDGKYPALYTGWIWKIKLTSANVEHIDIRLRLEGLK